MTKWYLTHQETLDSFINLFFDEMQSQPSGAGAVRFVGPRVRFNDVLQQRKVVDGFYPIGFNAKITRQV